MNEDLWKLIPCTEMEYWVRDNLWVLDHQKWSLIPDKILATPYPYTVFVRMRGYTRSFGSWATVPDINRAYWLYSQLYYFEKEVEVLCGGLS